MGETRKLMDELVSIKYVSPIVEAVPILKAVADCFGKMTVEEAKDALYDAAECRSREQFEIGLMDESDKALIELLGKNLKLYPANEAALRNLLKRREKGMDNG
mgnify:CR=1 FL=1